MKTVKKSLLLILLFVALALSMGKHQTAYAMQTLSLTMLPNSDNGVNNVISYDINYVTGSDVRTCTYEGTSYSGEVIAIKMPVKGRLVFRSIGGYSIGFQHMALFSDSALTQQLKDLESMKDTISYSSDKTAYLDLDKGTYYLFNGSSSYRPTDRGIYPIQVTAFALGTLTASSGKHYAWAGDTGCAKIVLDNSRNICIRTRFVSNIRILSSTKKELYTFDYTDRAANSKQYVFLKKGTYYIKFDNQYWWPNQFLYGYFSYSIEGWSGWGLSEAKSLPSQRSVPVAFKYTAQSSGYLTFTSPHNYADKIVQLNSSFKQIGKSDYTDGCAAQKACFVIQKGKTYYFKVYVNMVYCDPIIKLTYTVSKKSSCWTSTRAKAKEKTAISSTVTGTWQYGCTNPCWVKVKKTCDSSLNLKFKLNRYCKFTLQAYNSSGNVVKLNNGAGTKYSKMTFSRTKSGWGTKGAYLTAKKGTYYLKLTPVDGYCGKLKLTSN